MFQIPQMGGIAHFGAIARVDLTVRRPLRIAILADPYLPVPPRLYGGIERIIALLVEGLVDRGHQVVLWAAEGSTVPCEVIPYGVPPHQGFVNRLRELLQVMSGLVQRRRQFDLIHNFGRLAGLLPLFPSWIPKIQSYQREITPRNILWATRLAGATLSFTACSTHCRREVSHLGRWVTIYNGVRLADYAFRPDVPSDAPLTFLGRIERIKGAHTAVKVARETGRRLIIAGNVPFSEEAEHYFEEEIAPHIDGDQIVYVGPVDDRQKNELLGRSAALLMPIEWEEPFGIVMAEALACGTPVIGMRRGAVPEVVEHEITGFVCDTAGDMVEALSRLDTINRHACREWCTRLFSDRVIVDAYEQLYYRVTEFAQ